MVHFILWMKCVSSLVIMMKEMIKAFCDPFFYFEIYKFYLVYIYIKKC